MSKQLEEVMKEYKLSEEEHERIFEQIKTLGLFEKYPVKNPKAIIDIAPPASGKTGLNGFGNNQFVDNNVVIINSDELKPFHPKIDEIARKYPEFYTKVTDQESNTWTSALFDLALAGGYNVIFEGTGRNARIIQTIKDKMQGYEVIARGMAVNDLNCLISILERYENQVDTRGWGRLVTADHFYETYREMPNTIEAIEQSGMVSRVEIYKRGLIPITPIKIYDSTDEGNGRFSSAKLAVIGGRLEDERKANEYYKEKFEEIREMLRTRDISNEEWAILREIDRRHKEIEKKNEKSNRRSKSWCFN